MGHYAANTQGVEPSPDSTPPDDRRNEAGRLSLGQRAFRAAQKTSQKQQARQELTDAIGGAHEVLVSATTVFPFTLFPDTLTVDRTNLTVTRRSFFKVAEVMTIRIQDVLNVTGYVGPFFGSVHITTRFFVYKPYEVNFFWREDAMKVQRIMQGYIIAKQNDIDTSVLTTKELAGMLDELGRGADQT